jgi:hypothetical protein
MDSLRYLESQYKIGGNKGEILFSLIFMSQNPVFMPKTPLPQDFS